MLVRLLLEVASALWQILSPYPGKPIPCILPSMYSRGFPFCLAIFKSVPEMVFIHIKPEECVSSNFLFIDILILDFGAALKDQSHIVTSINLCYWLKYWDMSVAECRSFAVIPLLSQSVLPSLPVKPPHHWWHAMSPWAGTSEKEIPSGGLQTHCTQHSCCPGAWWMLTRIAWSCLFRVLMMTIQTHSI